MSSFYFVFYFWWSTKMQDTSMDPAQLNLLRVGMFIPRCLGQIPRSASCGTTDIDDGSNMIKPNANNKSCHICELYRFWVLKTTLPKRGLRWFMIEFTTWLMTCKYARLSWSTLILDSVFFNSMPCSTTTSKHAAFKTSHYTSLYIIQYSIHPTKAALLSSAIPFRIFHTFQCSSSQDRRQAQSS